MKSLFPYQGGKSKIAEQVWSLFGGNIKNYIEPFCGSAAVLFAKPPQIDCIETINDVDGLIINVYRSIQNYPDEVAQAADWPVSEVDCEARHHYLCQLYAQTDFANRMRMDINYCDPVAAGYWIYGACMWIGQGWCSDKQISKYQGGIPEIVKLIASGAGIKNHEAFGQLPHLGNAGTGINRKNHEGFGGLPHLGDAGRGINRKHEDFGRLPTIGARGLQTNRGSIYVAMQAYCQRIRNTRIVCGTFKRVLTPVCTYKRGLTAVFLDPPYVEAGWDNTYGYRDRHNSVWDDVTKWCTDNGDNQGLRIVLCGHYDDWDPPEPWRKIRWTRSRGYSKDSVSRFEECLFTNCASVNGVIDDSSLFKIWMK